MSRAEYLLQFIHRVTILSNNLCEITEIDNLLLLQLDENVKHLKKFLERDRNEKENAEPLNSCGGHYGCPDSPEAP